MSERPADAGTESPMLVRLWLMSALGWAVLLPVLGGLISIQMHAPDLLPALRWLSPGRLMTLQHSGLVLALFSTAAFGLVYYLVPRLTGVRMAFEGVGFLTWVLWQLGLVAGFALVLLQGDPLLDFLPKTPLMERFFTEGNQGLEAGPFPFGVDLLLGLCFLLTTVQAIVTSLRRVEPMLYVSLCYLLAGLVWTTLTFLLGNCVLPFTVGGVHSIGLQGMMAGNLVGLWVLPAGLAALHYFLPLGVAGPLYSARLAWLGFWTLALFQPLTGMAQHAFAPLPAWAQTLSIAAGLCVLIPVWAVASNVFGTLSGRWSSLHLSIANKFLLFGTVFYLVGSAMTATLALRDVARLLQHTPYADAAVSALTFGAGVFWILGGAYAAWERTSGRAMFSESMALWHFWLTLIGFGVGFLALVEAGVEQGWMLEFGADFTDVLVATRWSWLAHTGAQGLLLLGMLLFAGNILMTTRQRAEA